MSDGRTDGTVGHISQCRTPQPLQQDIRQCSDRGFSVDLIDGSRQQAGPELSASERICPQCMHNTHVSRYLSAVAYAHVGNNFH